MKRTQQRLVSRLAALFAWTVCVMPVGVTHPAEAALPAKNTATAQATFKFDIPSGMLDAVLGTFQGVTGLEVTAPPNTTIQGLNSPGVFGTYTADEALTRLLAGTGLTVRLSSANTYSLEVTGVTENVEVNASLPYRAGTTSTATKTLTPLIDVPQSVTVITRSMLSDQQMHDMADVVRYVPGVGMAQGEGHRDTPILRGNATTADLYVDGMRDDVQYFRDLYNVEYVEALKGPNAMIFGRGGAGGIINRTTRQADWGTARELTLQTGSHDHRRATFDIDHPLGSTVAARATGVYEDSGSYRRGVNLERYGVNPTLAFMLRNSTTARIGYERFHDKRTVDRGIPSSGSRPVATDASTFFGDPDLSNSAVTVDAFTAGIDHKFPGDVLLRNRTRVANYDKFYQNVYPSSAVSASDIVTIAAYNSAMQRQNLFTQTDVNLTSLTGRVRHIVLAGAELGRQVTDNVRNTGYFTGVGPTTTSFFVPVSAPTISVPLTFRPSATDANNHGIATVVALYAQDQVDLFQDVQAVVGVRYDRFEVDFRNHRTATDFSSRDNLLSPRVGLIYKPKQAMSVYTSYTLAYVPRAGEQLSSLSLSNQALEPETFINYEIGTKWDVRPELSVNAAVYQLDRTNVAIPDPADVTRSILVAGQRTRGVELGVSGRITPAWSAVGAYAYQDGKITRTLSASAHAGALLAQVPMQTFSLWNKYTIAPRWSVGAGIIHRGDMFASTDNTVVLPSVTRVDGALFLTLTKQLSGQVNIENLFDRRYYAFANGNDNITPGSPRALHVSLTTRF